MRDLTLVRLVNCSFHEMPDASFHLVASVFHHQVFSVRLMRLSKDVSNVIGNLDDRLVAIACLGHGRSSKC